MQAYWKGTKSSYNMKTFAANSSNTQRMREMVERYSKSPCFQTKDGNVIWVGYAQKVAIGKKNAIKVFLHTITGVLDAYETIHFGEAPKIHKNRS